MADLVVVVPSRGRPDAAKTLTQAFRDTCTGHTQLVFSLDDDDPTRLHYPNNVASFTASNRSMVQALNATAVTYAEGFSIVPPSFAIGFMGDDHRPRSKGWDQAYLDALHELGTGIVYGNDLLQGGNLPTQVAMTSDIVRALGYMAPPALTHLYVDNFWLMLGHALGRIQYLPDVIIEHMHPLARKANWDEGYTRVNNQAMYDKDHQAFAGYLATSFNPDVEKVRAVCG